MGIFLFGLDYATMVYIQQVFKEKVRLIHNFPPPHPHTERDTLHLLWRNSTVLFAYWELSARKRAMVAEHFGTDWKQLDPALRLYDITEMSFDGSTAHHFSQLSIGDSSSCYIHNLKPGRCYIADLGIINREQQFIPLLRSNSLDIPQADWSSTVKDLPTTVTLSTFAHSEGPTSLLLPHEYDRFSAYTLYYDQPFATDSASRGEQI
jgi:hypothetical protein